MMTAPTTTAATATEELPKVERQMDVPDENRMQMDVMDPSDDVINEESEAEDDDEDADNAVDDDDDDDDNVGNDEDDHDNDVAAEPEELDGALGLLAMFQDAEFPPPADRRREALDAPDQIIEMNGHVIGMRLSPDHRYLYVNLRAWTEEFQGDDGDDWEW